MNPENERAYVLKADVIKRLRKKKGISWTALADACHVHPGTIKRWLAGNGAMMDNIGLLAKALGTTADKLILADQNSELTNYVDSEILKDGDSDALNSPDEIAAIVSAVEKAIGAKRSFVLVYVSPANSIRIGLRIHKSDAIRLKKAFLAGKLEGLNIISVTVSGVNVSQSIPQVQHPDTHDIGDSLSAATQAGVAVLAVNETVLTAPKWNELEAKLPTLRGQRVIFDCTNVTSLDTYGLAKLITLNKSLRANDSLLILCNVPQFLKDAFALAHLDKLFVIRDDVASALRAP